MTTESTNREDWQNKLNWSHLDFFVETNPFVQLQKQISDFSNNPTFREKCLMVILTGLTGSGKTALATALQKNHAENDKMAANFFLHLDNEESFFEDLKQLALKLDPSFDRQYYEINVHINAPVTASVVGNEATATGDISNANVSAVRFAIPDNFKTYIKKTLPMVKQRKPWFIVMDSMDIDNRDKSSFSHLYLDVLNILRSCQGGIIVITSRQCRLYEDQKSTNHLAVIHANLEDANYRISLAQAKHLFCGTAQFTTAMTNYGSEIELELLINRLSFLPLALITCGKHVREEELKYADYIKLLNTNEKDLDCRIQTSLDNNPRFKPSEDNHHGSLTQRSVIRNCIDAAIKNFSENNQIKAKYCVGFCAFINRENISKQMIQTFINKLAALDNSEHTAAFYTNFKFNMEQYSLIRFKHSVSSIHREVQSVMREYEDALEKSKFIKLCTDTFEAHLTTAIDVIPHIASFYSQNKVDSDSQGMEYMTKFIEKFNKYHDLQVQQHKQKQAERLEESWKQDPSANANYPIIDGATLATSFIWASLARTKYRLPLKNERFTGRRSQIAALHNFFQGSGLRVYSIVGAGGMGKTALSLAYVYAALANKRYERVLWLDAEFSDQLLYQLRPLVTNWNGTDDNVMLNEAEIVDSFQKYLLGTESGNMCLVLDNAGDYNSVENYLPIVCKSNTVLKTNKVIDVIVTSRLIEWRNKFQLSSVKMEEMSLEEFRDYLQRAFPESIEADLATAVESLHKLLGGLPLALEQAVAYMKLNQLSIVNYCKQLEQQQLLFEKDTDTTCLTVQHMLTLAIDKVRQKCSAVDATISVCAYLATDYITKELLHLILKESDEKTNLSNPVISQPLSISAQANKEHLPKYQNKHAAPPALIDKALELLEQYSILTLQENSVRIHRLTQAVMRYIHKKNNLSADSYGQVVHFLVNNMDYDEKNKKDVDRVTSLIPHCLVLQESEYEHFVQQDLVTHFQLLVKTGKHQLGAVQNASQAIKCYEKARQIGTELYGENHSEIAAVLDNIARAHSLQGNYEEQLKLLNRALVIMETHHGPNDPQTSIILRNLGNAYGSLGKYEMQREFLSRSLTIQETHFGADHPETAITRGSLGNSYGSLGNYERQRDLLTSTLSVMEKHFGFSHPQTAATLVNLANALGSLGDNKQKIKLLKRALKIDEEHFGNDHPQTSITLTNLGNAYGSLGKFEKQRDILMRALSIKEKYFGIGHLQTCSTLASLGNAHGSLGDYSKQKERLVKACDIFKTHYGPHHPQTGITLHCLANAYGSLGDHEKQRDYLTQALDACEAHYGPCHQQTSIVLTDLGNTYGALEEYEKQRELLNRALTIDEVCFGRDHPQTVVALSHLASAYNSLEQYEDQRDALERALAILQTHCNSDDQQIGITLTNLGIAYGHLGNYKMQRDVLKRALPIVEKHFGRDHSQTSVAIFKLAEAQGSLGNYEQQRDLLTRYLAIVKAHFGRSSPETSSALVSLSQTYGKLENYEKQRKLLTRALKIDQARLGENHPKNISTPTALARAYGRLGNHEKQRDLLIQALNIAEISFGPNHFETGIAARALANFYAQLKDFPNALASAQRALNIFSNLQGDEYLQTLTVQDELQVFLNNIQLSEDDRSTNITNTPPDVTSELSKICTLI